MSRRVSRGRGWRTRLARNAGRRSGGDTCGSATTAWPAGTPTSTVSPRCPNTSPPGTLGDVTWNATLLGPDIAGAIEQLKAQPGKDLIKYGTSRVDDTLLRQRLIDELRLWIMPLVVGTGSRLFEDVDTSSLKLTLTHVRELRNGSVVLTYTRG